MMRDRSTDPRTRREMKTVRAMIGMYCRAHHETNDALCEACEQLWQYAQARVEHCPFGTDKPTCAKCPVHCYKRDMRERIRDVMRYAGPRMMWHHPFLALMHMVHGKEPVPERRTGKRG